MSCELGLSIGESFAELLGFADGHWIDAGADAKTAEPIVKARWYLPRKSLADGLKDALRDGLKDLPADQRGGRIRVISHSTPRILDKGQGRPPAVLTTAGFETWLNLRQPLQAQAFSNRAQRADLPSEEGHVFGVNARIDGQGQVQTPLLPAELETLAGKLDALKIKDVAVNYLYSELNPELERQTAHYLREKGFQVFLSHEQPGARPEERWRGAIESAFAQAALTEEREQIEQALEGATWTTEIWTSSGLRPLASAPLNTSAAWLRGGLAQALFQHAPNTYHCGLDGFFFVAATPFPFATSPTALIRHGAWSFPSISNESGGYAPGPMAFGKSHQLGVLDLLYVRTVLQDVEGLTGQLSDRSRSRILENLFTLAKSPSMHDQNRPAPDASKIAADLLRAFVERCAVCLAASLPLGERTVRLSGPLASTMLPLLKSRRPDLLFGLVPLAAWSEARAAIGDGLALDNESGKQEART